jgi:2-dehydro-3-deoxyglucarate aldolase/4-hydroxy-2-oxoheptanedioate aldolase
MEINNFEKFKKKTSAGRICIGMVITLSDPSVSELAGDVGFDFTWIDAEHAPHTAQTIMGHVMAVRGTDCAPFVRVPWNDPGILKPILDLAPAGVIIPMVNSAEEAAAAVAACRYPPQGIRGCGVRRSVRYGTTFFADYLKASASEPLVIIQIEHIDAVTNLDKILKVPGIDSICVGPCDLSGSMGILNQMDDPGLNKILDEICAKTRAAGIMLGAAGGPFDRWRDRGVNWIATGSDCGSMFAESRRILEECK